MKKNNTAEKTAQNAKKLVEALKESTKKSVMDIVNEAVEEVIMNEDDDKDEDKEVDKTESEIEDLGDSYEVEDVETDDEKEDKGEDADDKEDSKSEETEEGDEEWSDFEDYKVGDNEYDFTGLEGEDNEDNEDIALKVYNKLGDDDQIIVKKESDGKYSVTDDETGAEYVIELDAECDESPEENVDDEEFSLEISDDEEPVEDDVENDIEDDDVEDDEYIDIEFDDDDDDLEELDEEKQEWTDKYQKKDAIEGLKMTEPAVNSRVIDKGIPNGTERPYAGNAKANGNPFGEKVNECGFSDSEPVLDEEGSGKNTQRSTKKSTRRINKDTYGQHNVSTPETAEVHAQLNETARKIYEKAKLIQEENKKYKAYIQEIKKSLTEAAVLNVSLTQAVKLMVENTTTAKEKKSILERFNNVHSLKESKELYNTIKTELNESKQSGLPNIDSQMSVEPTKNTINETTIYGNTKQNPALDLMNRLDNLWK